MNLDVQKPKTKTEDLLPSITKNLGTFYQKLQTKTQ